MDVMVGLGDQGESGERGGWGGWAGWGVFYVFLVPTTTTPRRIHEAFVNRLTYGCKPVKKLIIIKFLRPLLTNAKAKVYTDLNPARISHTLVGF